MKTGNGYFEDSAGNKSSSRALGVGVVVYALALATAVLVFGFLEETKVMLSAVASGTIFTTMIGGPAMFFMFSNKVEEGKQAISTANAVLDEKKEINKNK